MIRQITSIPNNRYSKCPVCGNNTEFTVHTRQLNEDCCEIWAVCICGYDPTDEATGNRYEALIGAVTNDTVAAALHCWNDAISTGSSKVDVP